MELALVLAEEFDFVPLPKVLLTNIGVSYLTSENPELCSDIFNNLNQSVSSRYVAKRVTRQSHGLTSRR
jgi:hypothetical protein